MDKNLVARGPRTLAGKRSWLVRVGMLQAAPFGNLRGARMSVILGLNSHHPDAAACLVVDGHLVAAVAEERLGERLKHSPRFPEHAIRFVLKYAGLRARDITHVAIPRDTRTNRLNKLRYLLRHPGRGVHAVGRYPSSQQEDGGGVRSHRARSGRGS